MIVARKRPKTAHHFRDKTVSNVDLSRFSGDWFVQGHTHLWIDRNKADQLEQYTMMGKDQIQVQFSFQQLGRRVRFQQKAWVADPETNAHWHIQFVYPFWSDYLIVGLDPDYQWTLVSVPDRSLMWIMTREKQIHEGKYLQLVQKLKLDGYPVEKLQRVRQG